MDLSKPGTRWAIFVIVVVAIALAGVGLYASRQTNSYPCQSTDFGPYGRCTFPQSSYASAAFLRPDHAVWFYGAAGAVLVLGLLAIWAASAGKRGPSES